MLSGKILQQLPNFDDEATEPSQHVEVPAAGTKHHSTQSLGSIGQLIPPPLHHRSVARSELIYEPSNSPGLCQ